MPTSSSNSNGRLWRKPARGSASKEDEAVSTRELKRYNVMGVRFDVDVRYNVLDVVGQGAYGVVCAAHDEDKDESVAIKKIFHPFEYVTLAKRTLREIRLLRLLQHDNVIRLRTLLPPVRSDGFKDLYIVLDLMETDLASVIKSPQHLSDDHVQFFIYQVLTGVKFLHTSVPTVTHRDLKPRNLLVNSNCDLKICDFGLARVDFERRDSACSSATTTTASTSLSSSSRGGDGGGGSSSSSAKPRVMTDYVATRWYRAPEIITGYVEYTKAVDLWAVGCILAELLGRKPLWPGSDSQHQLGLICQCIGKPPPETISRIQQREMRQFVDSIPQRCVAFTELYPDVNPLACDLLCKLLVFEPEQRIDVLRALEHPYLAQLHFPEDEPRGPEIPLEAFAFESEANLSVAQLRAEILKEISYYHEENKIASSSSTAAAARPAPTLPTLPSHDEKQDEDVDGTPPDSGIGGA